MWEKLFRNGDPPGHRRARRREEALVTAAYQQDEADDAVLGSRRGDEFPAELARREQRLATIAAPRQR